MVMPADIPGNLKWDECVVPISYHTLQMRDRKRVKKAAKKVSKITGVTFRKTRDTTVGINFEYDLMLDAGPTLATASVQWLDKRWIRWSGVRLYRSYLSWSDKKMVIHHEFHHAMGVVHNDRFSSLMHPTSHGQWYDKKDVRKLKRKYKHCG